MQIDQISIKFFGHKHNTLLSCHVIIDGRYTKSHFEQKQYIRWSKYKEIDLKTPKNGKKLGKNPVSSNFHQMFLS